jgi:CRISPR/Cas system-associated exonuclease Cas4 (RecB family)
MINEIAEVKEENNKRPDEENNNICRRCVYPGERKKEIQEILKQ